MFPPCSVCHEPVNVAKSDICRLLLLMLLQKTRVCVDVVIFDVHDELGQRVEVKPAAPKSAFVGKEGSGSDACHGCWCIKIRASSSSGRQQADSDANSWSHGAGAVLCAVATSATSEQTGSMRRFDITHVKVCGLRVSLRLCGRAVGFKDNHTGASPWTCMALYEKLARVMNSDQERPFMCNAPGCSQRFPTEDHLMIHRHKHEMTLKFPAIKNDNMLSDQTPTPTRFLKNCEEVGLFSDLDCSIEQEFCKAQEEEDNKQNITLHSQAGQGQHQQAHSRMGNHDTSIVIQQALPSPQSSSVITQAPSTNRQIGPVPGSLSSLLHLRNRQRQPLPASMPGTLPDPTMPGSSAVLMPMERQMSMASNMMGMHGPAHSNSCSSTHIPTMHSETKMRLKAALSQHPGAIANGNMNSMGHMMEMMSSRQEQGTHHHMHSHPHQHLQAPPHTYQHHAHHHHNQGGHHHPQGHNPHHNSHNPHLHPGHPHQTSPHPPMHSASQMSPATQQMQPTQTLQSPQSSGGRRRRVVDEDPDERRRKFLERNRAAATRCRQKRKVWVMSLEKKAEELTQTNMQLQNEVTMLKNEVTQLKQLLLTHKDCPITTMQKESQGYLSPESSPAGSPAPVGSQQQVIQHNTITTSTTTVGGNSVHGQANHRTDINPIH